MPPECGFGLLDRELQGHELHHQVSALYLVQARLLGCLSGAARARREAQTQGMGRLDDELDGFVLLFGQCH